jgi:hypothetical protein
VLQKVLLASDPQGTYFGKLRHCTNCRQQRICFHLWVGAVILCDRLAQFGIHTIRLFAERVPCGEHVFSEPVASSHQLRTHLLSRPIYFGGWTVLQAGLQQLLAVKAVGSKELKC